MSGRTQEPAWERKQHFAYGALTLYGAASQPLRLYRFFVTLRVGCSRLMASPPTLRALSPHAITYAKFRLVPFRSPLLRESRFLSFPQATKMFQFACLPSLPYVFRQG